MKPLRHSEVKKLCETFQVLLDSKIQNCHVFKSGFVLECFKQGQTLFWLFDLKPNSPFCSIFEKCPVSLLKSKKPLSLFLNAHAKNKRISKIEYDESLGRGFLFEVGYEDVVKAEVRLFPHGQNLIINFQNKKISAFPVKEIKKNQDLSVDIEPRPIEDLLQEWKSQFQKAKVEINVDALIERKKRAIQKTEEALQLMQNQEWIDVGHWIQHNQSLQVPEKYKDYVDSSISIARNLDKIFTKAKELKHNIEQAYLRLSHLKSELELLEKGEIPEQKKTAQVQKGQKSFSISDQIELFIGKNASDNLLLLRESQPWHLWLHLKDYPGAHGILRFSKGIQLKPQEIELAAQKVAERSQKSHHHIQAGDVFDVLVVEKRFVKPIKGDKLGRVRYSNEQVYSVKKT